MDLLRDPQKYTQSAAKGTLAFIAPLTPQRFGLHRQPIGIWKELDYRLSCPLQRETGVEVKPLWGEPGDELVDQLSVARTQAVR